MLRQRLSGVFYGWWIVAAGFGIQLLVGGLLNQAYGAYVVLLQRDFGWSKTMLSAAFSLTRVESGLLGPPQGWMIDRYGPRAVMRLGIVMFGLGFMGFSQINSPVAFFSLFMVMAVGSSLGGFFPLTVAVVNWFEKRRATALSAMSLGFAVGGLIVPLIVICLETFGWRWTAFGSGVIVIVTGLPLVQLVHHRPEDLGLRIDGAPALVPGLAGPRQDSVDELELTAAEALRTPAFWFISLGHAFALLVVGAVTVHVVAFLNEDLGYTLAEAALFVTLMTFMQVIGMVIGGVAGDRFSKRAIATGCMGMHALGLILLAQATALWMPLAFSVLHGLAWGIRGPLMQAIRADYFGRKSFGTIMGLSSLIVMFGQVFGPLVAGILADRTGSYESGFMILAIMAGFGSIFFILSVKPKPRPRPAGATTPAAIADGLPATSGD